jgi:hypothetical protein
MHLGKRHSTLLLIVALLGFNAPSCILACSMATAQTSPTAATVEAGVHASCHDASPQQSDPGPEAGHDCRLRSGFGALATAMDAPPTPSTPSPAFAPAMLAPPQLEVASRPELALGPWRPPDGRHILLWKSSLLI